MSVEGHAIFIKYISLTNCGQVSLCPSEGTLIASNWEKMGFL